MDTNFAYLRDDRYNFFIALGDNHEDDTVSCLPVYAPDPDGAREYDEVRLSKQPKDGSADLAGDGYEQSPIRFGALEVERDRVEEVVDPYRDRDQVLANMDGESRAVYEEIEALLDEPDQLMAIGSDTYGVGTDSSDLDLVWLGDYDRFHDDVLPGLEDGLGLEEVGDDWLDDRIRSHAERYDVPEEVARYHHEQPQQRYFRDDLKVGFSPSQEPGSWDGFERPAPDDAYEEVTLEATIEDAEHNDSWPRNVELDAGDRDLDLVTYFWAYGGSFEEGDEIVVDGQLVESKDTVYLREPGDYAAPVDVLGPA
ncbi:MAG: hypothetical protein SV186_06095 [Candidatus Nanohaloarchaea archaeon]|nr:hypothetical protein [Candidatus Nanohaloarchaea archaeon]